MTFARSHWTLAWVLVGIVAVIMFDVGRGAPEYWISLWSAVLLGGPALAFLWSLRYRIEVRRDGLTAVSPWRGRRSIRWEHIARLEASGYVSSLRIVSEDGTVIAVPSLLGGVDSLESEFERRLPPRLWVEAFKKLHRFRAR